MKTLTKYLKFWSVRLFFLLIIGLIAFGGYFYSVPQINAGNVILINPFYNQSENIPTWLYEVDYFIFIFLVTSVLIIFMILYYNANKSKEEKIDKEHMITFVEKIFFFLYPVEEYNEKQKKNQLNGIKKDLTNDHSKQLFLNTLRKIHAQTTGLVSEKTAYLSKEINYTNFIRANLYSPYFSDNLFALKVIGDFQLKGYEKHILKLTKRKNGVLHSEAIVTLLKLKIYDNLLFLIDINMELSIWDLNIIIKTVQELNILNIDYLSLIQSETAEISALGIILVRLRNKSDFKSEIKLKIGSANPLVSEEACITYCYLANCVEEYAYLIEIFNIVSEKSQSTIISKIATTQDKTVSVKFLNFVVNNQPFSQKVEAIRLLLDLDINVISEFRNSENLVIRQSCYQVLDINL